MPGDIQSIFDALPAKDTDLFWVRGTTRRWEGYTHFQREPEQVLAWSDKHMA